MRIFTKRFHLTLLVTQVILLTMGLAHYANNMPLSWGYSEFLVNYSNGFIRRGLPGTILIEISNSTEIPVHTILTIALSIVLLIVLISVFVLLVENRTVTKLGFILLFFNPTLLLFVISGDTFYRKDWFISLGLVAHGLVSLKIKKAKIGRRTYSIFLALLSIYLILISLSHEINTFFIPVHIFMIARNSLLFPGQNSQLKIHKFFIAGTQVFLFVLLFKFRGELESGRMILESLPVSIWSDGLYPPAIESIGWPFSKFIEINAEMLALQSLMGYLVIFTCGPGLIFWLTLRGSLHDNWRVYLVVLGIQVLLFLIGWDWGRWISLISFCLVSLTVFNTEKKSNEIETPTKSQQLLSFWKIKDLAVGGGVLIILLSIQAPSHGPRPYFGFQLSQIVFYIFEIYHNK